MPYIPETHRVWLSKTLDDLIEWTSWNLHLMGTRDDTFYHIVRRILEAFYGCKESIAIPPLDEEKRSLVDKKLMPLINTIKSNPALMEKRNGTLNYTICRIMNALYPKEHSRYSDFNNSVGVLETALRETALKEDQRYDANGMVRCAIEEWYRRRVGPYETDACDNQGDVFD